LLQLDLEQVLFSAQVEQVSELRPRQKCRKGQHSWVCAGRSRSVREKLGWK